MSVLDSIKEAKNQGASDDQIISEIIKQNPDKAGVFQEATKKGADSSAILSEIITQNTPSTISRVSKGVGKFLGEATGIMGIFKAGKEALTTDRPLKEILPEAVGSAAKLGLTLGTLGSGTVAKTVGGRILAGGGLGAGFGGASALEKGKSVGEIGKEAAIGGAIGVGTAGAAEGIRWAVKGVPKLLSYFSDTPDEVLKRQYDNPGLAAQTLKEVKASGATGVLDDVQNAAKKLRKDLTQQWQEGTKVIIEKNTGARVSFTQNEISKLQKVASDFGIDLPQNLSKVSVKESLELNKELNELFSKRAIRESAQGVIVRKTKELLSAKLSRFQGTKELMSNYGAEKEVLDAISDIVKPYNKNPVTQSTALARVKAVFNENRPAFLSAVKDLEESTGIPLLDKAATLSILRRAPISGQRLFSQFAEALFFPLTSPRAAGFESRTAGRLGNSSISQPTRTFLGEGVRKLIRE